MKAHRLLNIDRGDYAALALLAPVFAAVAASTVVLASLSKALFLSANPISVLPWLFLGSAGITAVSSLAYVAAMRRFRLEVRISRLFALSAGTLAALRLLFSAAPGPLSVLIALVCPSMGHLLIMQAWNIASSLLPTRQGKRLLPVLAAVTTAGAALGGGLVQLLLQWIGAEDLLWLALALLAWPMLTVRSVVLRLRAHTGERTNELGSREAGQPSSDTETRSELRQGLESLRRIPLLGELALFVLLLQAASLLVDYQFSAELKVAFTKDAIAGFLGAFYGLSNVVVLALTLTATSRIVKFLGIGLALSASALALAIGSGIYLAASLTGAVSMFWTIAATAFAERIGQYALTKPAVQMLYMPLAAQTAERAKTLIDGVVQRLATIGVSVLLLIASLGLASQVRLSAPAIVACVVALVVAARLRPHYRRAIFSALRANRLELSVSRYLGDGLGKAAVHDVEQRLAGSDSREVLRSLEIARELQLPVQEAMLKQHAQSADPDVSQAALRAMTALSCPLDRPLWSELLRSERPSQLLRAALQSVDDGQLPQLAELIRPLTRHPDSSVASLASVLHIRTVGQAAAKALDDEIASGALRDQAASTAGGRPTGMTMAGDFARELPALLAHRSLAVQRGAIEQMGQLALPYFVRPLIERLAHSEVRNQVIAALVRYGAKIFPDVEKWLALPGSKLATRVGLLEVLEALATGAAVRLLVAQAQSEEPTLRSQAVACLWRVASADDAPRPDDTALDALVAEELTRLRRYAAVEAALGGAKVNVRMMFFARELDASRRETERRVFMLLGLRYDRAALLRALSNYDSTEHRTRSNAIELLEQHVTDANSRAFVPLVERAEDREGKLRPRSVVYDNIANSTSVGQLLGDEDAWLGRVWSWAEDAERAEAAEARADRPLDRMLSLVASPLFGNMNGRLLCPLAEAVEEVNAAAGQRILQQGSDDQTLYLVTDGEVELIRDGEPVGRVARGGCFGELPLMDGGQQCCAVRAVSDVTVLVLPPEQLVDIMVLEPSFIRELIGLLTRRLRGRIIRRSDAQPIAASASGSKSIAGFSPAPLMHAMDGLARLRQVPLFAGLGAEQLLLITEIARLVKVPAGRTVFVEGSGGEHLYVIAAGSVEVSSADRKIAELGENDCFGEMAVLDRTERSATVRTTTDTTLLAMGRDDFGELLELHPGLARGIMSVLAQRARASLSARRGSRDRQG